MDEQTDGGSRAIFDDEGHFHGHRGGECGEHRTVGHHRAWCFGCQEWCYPGQPCASCERPMLEARAESAERERDVARRCNERLRADNDRLRGVLNKVRNEEVGHAHWCGWWTDRRFCECIAGKVDRVLSADADTDAEPEPCSCGHARTQHGASGCNQRFCGCLGPFPPEPSRAEGECVCHRGRDEAKHCPHHTLADYDAQGRFRDQRYGEGDDGRSRVADALDKEMPAASRKECEDAADRLLASGGVALREDVLHERWWGNAHFADWQRKRDRVRRLETALRDLIERIEGAHDDDCREGAFIKCPCEWRAKDRARAALEDRDGQ